MNTSNQTQLGLLTALIVATLLALGPSSASAHFLLNLNVRIMHIEHTAAGANIYMRLPLPYLLADKVGASTQQDALPTPAPFTHNAMEEGRLVHYVDFQQVSRTPLGLGEIAARATNLSSQGSVLPNEVTAVHLYPVGTEPDFATLEEAQRAFSTSAEEATATLQGPLYVGDTIIDVLIHYPLTSPLDDYSISSSLNPGLPDQENTANLVLDYRAGKTQVFRSSGLINAPIEISHSTVDAMATFIHEGVIHILAGLDHVLFVLCLTLGAGTLTALLWRATGFTVGHSITLSAGFMGLVPSGAWFVPLVETSIALSIIYVAWISIRKSVATDSKNEFTIFLGTGVLGLLHGLGFSFVLHEILRVNSPNIWQSLLAFNVGVEIGQALIILAVWPLLMIIRHWKRSWEPPLRISVAATCSAIAMVWTIDRSSQLVTSLALGS